MATIISSAFFCIPEWLMGRKERVLYAGLSVVSAVFGSCGALWQICRWRPLMSEYQTRRKPSPNPRVVLALALADLLACISVLVRALLILVTDPPTPTLVYSLSDGGAVTHLVPLNGSTWALVLSTSVETVNTYFYRVTYSWTILYAVDIYRQLCEKDTGRFLYYNLSSWGLQGALTGLSMLVTSLYEKFPFVCAPRENIIGRLLIQLFVLSTALILLPIIYGLANAQIRRRVREAGLVSGHHRAIMTALQRKFLAVIVIFGFCWLPNFIDLIIQLVVLGAGDVTPSAARFFPLWAIEAVLNPLQGLMNCLPYGRHLWFRRLAEWQILDRTRYDTDFTESTPILDRSGVISES